MRYFILFFILHIPLTAFVKPGVECFFQDGLDEIYLSGKRVGLITNHSAIDRSYRPTWTIFRDRAKKYRLTALFTPEHGLFGDVWADKKIEYDQIGGIIVHSLYGQTRRPTEAMLKQIDILVYDIQDIGTRGYTYTTTLFYAMEEAAKHHIPLIVLDRPNPLGGIIVDGLGVKENCRSFCGYVDVPYCHGMTVGELARFFNEEYHVGANLTVVPMQGWQRSMPFSQTALPWVPLSPHVPEADTPFFFSTTGLIGELSLASIGIGYTTPFKVVGAPWIDAERFAAKLNEQKLSGVIFVPFHFRPFFGKYKGEACQGVLLVLSDPMQLKPLTTQFTMLGVLKSLWPQEFDKALEQLSQTKAKRELFNKLNGSDEVLATMLKEKYFVWPLRDRFDKERERFLQIRSKHLLYS